jgi:hypothetical protein
MDRKLFYHKSVCSTKRKKQLTAGGQPWLLVGTCSGCKPPAVVPSRNWFAVETNDSADQVLALGKGKRDVWITMGRTADSGNECRETHKRSNTVCCADALGVHSSQTTMRNNVS